MGVGGSKQVAKNGGCDNWGPVRSEHYYFFFEHYLQASFLASLSPFYFHLGLLPGPCDLRVHEGAFQISYKTSFIQGTAPHPTPAQVPAVTGFLKAHRCARLPRPTDSSVSKKIKYPGEFFRVWFGLVRGEEFNPSF